jgi:hypothetical protein
VLLLLLLWAAATAYPAVCVPPLTAAHRARSTALHMQRGWNWMPQEVAEQQRRHGNLGRAAPAAASQLQLWPHALELIWDLRLLFTI